MAHDSLDIPEIDVLSELETRIKETGEAKDGGNVRDVLPEVPKTRTYCAPQLSP